MTALISQSCRAPLSWVILMTPLGVFAIVLDFQVSTADRTRLLLELGSFCLLVFFVTIAHGLVVLPTIAWIFGRISPVNFLANILQPMMVAFSTSSSSSTLPITLNACEQNLKLPKRVTGFVCPLGATLNMHGTGLYEAIAAIFLANLFEIELGMPAILVLFFVVMISSLASPGMPSGGMAAMQMVLLAVGIPLEGIGILLVVEKFMDTFRTAVNVEGDIVGAVVADRYCEAT